MSEKSFIDVNHETKEIDGVKTCPQLLPWILM